MPAKRICPNCKRLVAARTKCVCHRVTYGEQWRKHSQARRAQQPWCSDCGTHEDLTVDHPTDDVVCRSCNSVRGHTTMQRPGG